VAVQRWDAEAAKVPLVYASSDTAAVFLPVTLAYFIFDLLLVPVWEGTLAVRCWSLNLVEMAWLGWLRWLAG
jgi:hypothetical protein